MFRFSGQISVIIREITPNEPFRRKTIKAGVVCRSNNQDFATNDENNKKHAYLAKIFFSGYNWEESFMFFITDDLKDKCEKLLCKCDRDAAKCLRKAPFIRKYALWPDFLCGSEHPTCNIYWHHKCICMSYMPFANICWSHNGNGRNVK